MIIRPITSADFDPIEKLIRKTILDVNSKDYAPDIIDRMLLHDPFAPQKYQTERSYFVAEEDGVLYGIIGMKDDEIKTFFVDSDYHGKGVGTLLIGYIENCIRLKGFQKSKVFSSKSARSFYEKNGYVLIREDFHKTGDIVMLRYYLEKDILNNRWSFGGNQDLARRLISLVLSGKKTSTTGLYLQDESYGKVGEYAIIYDELTGDDLCVIHYTKVEVKAFMEVDMDHIMKEGEGDQDLDSWRRSHRDFFEKEYPGLFTDDSLVVCEEFRLIKSLSA